MKDKSYNKYTFILADEENPKVKVSECLGLSDEFTNRLTETIVKEVVGGLISGTHESEIFQNTMNAMLPNDTVEAFYVGYAVAKAIDKFEDSLIDHPLAMMMKLMARNNRGK